MFWSAIVHWLMAYGQELIWIVSDLERECLENWWRRHLPKEQWMWRYLCSLSMVIGRWLHLRRSSIKHIGWPILGKIRLIPVIAQYAHKQSGHGGRDRVMYRFNNMESHQVWPDCSCCWVPVLPTTETNIEPRIWHHSQCYQLSLWWQVEYFGSFLLWKRRCFVFTGVDLILDRDLPFLEIMLLTKLSSMDLKKA